MSNIDNIYIYTPFDSRYNKKKNSKTIKINALTNYCNFAYRQEYNILTLYAAKGSPNMLNSGSIRVGIKICEQIANVTTLAWYARRGSIFGATTSRFF